MRLADFLDPKDREAVLGDLTESGAGRFERFREVVRLLLRRQGWVMLLALFLVIVTANQASDLSWRFAAYFFHQSAFAAGTGRMPTWNKVYSVLSGGFGIGFYLGYRSGRALPLNISVLIIASVLFSLGDDQIPYGHTLPVLFGLVFLGGAIVVGALFGRRSAI
jgi:hypothetical protein